MQQPPVDVSVIVPVRNGRAMLRELLEDLEKQTLSPERFEIVIGEDGSIDGTSEAVATADRRIRVLGGPERNAYVARNRAARAARGRVLAFVDADCTPEPEWLDEGLRTLADADIAGGLIRLRVPARPTVWTLVSLDTFHDQELAVESGRALTGNLFVRRELFDAVGGFDESLPSGGDFDFVSRCLGERARLALARDAIVWHPTFDTSRALLWRIWYDGRSRAARIREAGGRPPALRLRWWVPVVSAARARRRAGRPLLLDRARLARSGIAVRRRDQAASAVVLYAAMHYLSGIAELVGWRDAREQPSGARTANSSRRASRYPVPNRRSGSR